MFVAARQTTVAAILKLSPVYGQGVYAPALSLLEAMMDGDKAINAGAVHQQDEICMPCSHSLRQAAHLRLL